MDTSFLASLDWTAILDCLAVIIGAATGALFAVARKLDIVGCVALGLVTAYGGGIIRDTLLSTHGFFFMQHADLIVACLTTARQISESYQNKFDFFSKLDNMIIE